MISTKNNILYEEKFILYTEILDFYWSSDPEL